MEPNSPLELPRLSLGVYRMSNPAAQQAVETALELGYTSIDTASYYNNEEAVGRAIRRSGVDRENVFVTTKLWNSDQGKHAFSALERSLELLGLDYVDSYLLHWPEPRKFVRSWEVLQPAIEQGLVRKLGVSNFMPRHLEQLKDIGCTPYVNQVEMHPYLRQDAIRDYDERHNIVTSSWSPLANGGILGDATLEGIANRLQVSTAQVALAWAMNLGVRVVAKASSTEHLQQNLDATGLELSESDMSAINDLNRDFHIDWNPEYA